MSRRGTIFTLLQNSLHRIAARSTNPTSPLWRAEITRLQVLLIVEGALALASLGFAINDGLTGWPGLAIAEGLIGLFFLSATPYWRLRYHSTAIDIADLTAVAVLIFTLTYTLLPLDITVLFLIPLFPPMAALLRRREGWRWVLGFIPLHWSVSWLTLTLHQGPSPALQNDLLPPTLQSMAPLLLTDYLMYLLIALIVNASTAMLEGYEAAWHEAAAKDPLTGTYNRLAFRTLYPRYHEQAQQGGTPLAVMLLDIDNFKHINDRFGHNTGDVVLKEVSSVLQQGIRRTDLLVRWGGEEFLILLPDTSLPEALHLAERLRGHIHQHTFPVAQPVTASFGVAELRTGESQETFIHRCDEALYLAKQRGKNRVAYWDSAPSPNQPQLLYETF